MLRIATILNKKNSLLSYVWNKQLSLWSLTVKTLIKKNSIYLANTRIGSKNMNSFFAPYLLVVYDPFIFIRVYVLARYKIFQMASYIISVDFITGIFSLMTGPKISTDTYVLSFKTSQTLSRLLNSEKEIYSYF